MSRGDQGETTRPGHRRRGFSPVYAPPRGLSHRSMSTLAGLGVLPSELAGGPGTRWAMLRGPQAHVQGFRPVHSTEEGSPFLPTATPSVSLALLSRFCQVRRGRWRWSPGSSFPS